MEQENKTELKQTEPKQTGLEQTEYEKMMEALQATFNENIPNIPETIFDVNFNINQLPLITVENLVKKIKIPPITTATLETISPNSCNIALRIFKSS